MNGALLFPYVDNIGLWTRPETNYEYINSARDIPIV